MTGSALARSRQAAVTGASGRGAVDAYAPRAMQQVTSAPALARRVRSWRQADSPTRLRAASLATAALAVLLSVVGFGAVQRRADAIDDATAAAGQLIRVQEVRVDLVEADSLASTAYLVGGLESRDDRVAYDERIAAVSDGLVAAASAAVGDEAALLAQASTDLTTYVGLVEQARANNRQGFPVGAAYQKQARVVAAGIVEHLRGVETSARDRVDSSVERGHLASWPLVLLTVALLAALVAGSLWLARRWRRLVNVPLAIGALAVLLLLTVGVGINASAISDADGVVEGSLTTADLLSQARAAAFDARSNEALTLIARGNGGAYEVQWQASSDIVQRAMGQACDEFGVGCRELEIYGTYETGHRAIRALDDRGSWDAAVELSLTGSSADAPGGLLDPVGAFEEVADVVGQQVTRETDDAVSGLADAGSSLGGLRWMVVIAGIAVALLSLAGYGQRIREYR